MPTLQLLNTYVICKKLVHVFVVGYHLPVAPLGLKCTGLWCFYTPSAPLGLLKASAQRISIAVTVHSFDRNLQTALFKQVLKSAPIT